MTHTLLLADDSVTIQRVIELTFADEDVQVVAVSDGDQAIARLDAAPPDIVLADIGMPGRNGYEVARYVKQSPKLSHIPVVLLTGAFEPVDQARAIEVGCDGVLAKPFEPQLVIGRVKELLTSERRAAAAPASSSSAPGATAAPTPEPADLDDYFDRLDVAFAKLSGQPVGKAATEPEPEPEPATELGRQPTPDSVADQIDWYAQRSGDSAPSVPVSYASPASAFETPPEPSPESIATVPAPAMPAPAPAAAAASSPAPPAAEPVTGAPVVPATQGSTPAPSIADAFAAILAAERHEPAADGAPQWPASFAPPAPAAPEITEDVIDTITRRVLDQMSDRVVRETVSDVVAEVAERLVRDEIAKIKSALK